LINNKERHTSIENKVHVLEGDLATLEEQREELLDRLSKQDVLLKTVNASVAEQNRRKRSYVMTKNHETVGSASQEEGSFYQGSESSESSQNTAVAVKVKPRTGSPRKKMVEPNYSASPTKGDSVASPNAKKSAPSTVSCPGQEEHHSLGKDFEVGQRAFLDRKLKAMSHWCVMIGSESHLKDGRKALFFTDNGERSSRKPENI